jgi:hypothetical protein
LLIGLFILHRWLPAEVFPQVAQAAWPLFDGDHPLCWLAALNLLAALFIAGLRTNPFDVVEDFGGKWLSMFDRGLIVGWQSKAMLLIWLRCLAEAFPTDGRFMELFTAFHVDKLWEDDPELVERVSVVKHLVASPVKAFASQFRPPLPVPDKTA